MRLRYIYSKYTIIFFFTIILFFSWPEFNHYSVANSSISDVLLAVDQTETATSTATVTPSETSTETVISIDASETPAFTSTIAGTTTDTIQPTASTTGLPTTTNTSVPSVTATRTPDYTNTPGPTETLIPLPSITLLFPIETDTSTPLGNTQDELKTAEASISDSSPKTPERISAQSILLIGTIIMLWVILAIFVIFYIKKMSE